MGTLSKSQWIGIAVFCVAVFVTLVGLLAFTSRNLSAPGITLRETFREPPGIPPSPTPQRRSIFPSSEPAEARIQAANATGHQASNEESIAAPEDKPGEVVVHVAGAVKKPGVYRLVPGARGDDALKAAGGPRLDANTDAVNLAAKVEDGSQLYVPTRQQQPTGGAPDSGDDSKLLATTAGSKKKQTKWSGTNRTTGAVRGSKSSKLTDPKQGYININTASAEELQKLPGIGPSMAERILAFRKENHGFQSPEDLMSVSGIGEKKFARMQPFVRAH